MIEPRLQSQFKKLEALRRKTRLWNRLAGCWFLVALILIVLQLINLATGFRSARAVMVILVCGFVTALIIWMRERRRPDDLPKLAAVLENREEKLRPLLSTALEQEPDAVSGELSFLQKRVVHQALAIPQWRVWRKVFERKLIGARIVHFVALVSVVIVCSLLNSSRTVSNKPWFAENTTIEPGDAEVERGTGLVITIRFEEQPPTEAVLVLKGESGNTKRIPLERHLADPMFGASLREIMESGVYHIEYGNEKTREYAIRVFDYPALLRADAALRFPEYTGLTNKNIPDTLRVTAVEGSRLDYSFELNKPVTEARLVAKDRAVPLVSGSNGVALLSDFILTDSGRYALQLVDADGRTNRRQSEIVLQVIPNRPPDLKLTFPQGDQRVSSVQEFQLQAEASDDFGLLKYGFGFGVAGEDPRLVEFGQRGGRDEKRPFDHMIDLEQLGVEVDQVVSYFVWADDYGPGGEVRRTYSDMFFAEVRPFEEVFRADQSGDSGAGDQGQGGQGGANDPGRLTELQKQIVIATWKLQREKSASSVSKP